MKHQQRQTDRQKRRHHWQREANSRGVFAVRRKVSPESFGVLEKIGESLRPELTNTGTLSEVRSLGVTVIALSRIKHDRVPSTSSITEQVKSASQPIEAKLGGLAIFGAELRAKDSAKNVRPRKLGVRIISDELVKEAADYEVQFEAEGCPLVDDRNGYGYYEPHLSIALIYGDYLRYFQDPRMLRKLGAITNLSNTCGLPIVLNPVRTPSSISTSQAANQAIYS